MFTKKKKELPTSVIEAFEMIFTRLDEMEKIIDKKLKSPEETKAFLERIDATTKFYQDTINQLIANPPKAEVQVVQLSRRRGEDEDDDDYNENNPKLSRIAELKKKQQLLKKKYGSNSGFGKIDAMANDK